MTVCGLILTSCILRALRHDQHVAAARAHEFLKLAVVDRSLDHAYALIKEEDRRAVSLTAFGEAVRSAHPDGFPTRLRALAYEPVRGQALINIFLVGENSGLRFYYRIPMVGTVDTGYAPGGLFRVEHPPPASALPL